MDQPQTIPGPGFRARLMRALRRLDDAIHATDDVPLAERVAMLERELAEVERRLRAGDGPGAG